MDHLDLPVHFHPAMEHNRQLEQQQQQQQQQAMDNSRHMVQQGGGPGQAQPLSHTPQTHDTNGGAAADHAPTPTQEENKKKTAKTPGSKPHRCEECGISFTRLDHLMRHKRTGKAHVNKNADGDDPDDENSDAYPHRCPECGKGFLRSDHLNRHRRSHIGSRRCKCSQCGEWLPSRPARNQHMWESHGLQLFECGQCAWGFTKASYLTRHLREKHSDVSEGESHQSHRRYTCGVCSVDFLRASQVAKHMELHHPQSAGLPEHGNTVFPPQTSSQHEAFTQNADRPQQTVGQEQGAGGQNVQHNTATQQRGANQAARKRHACPDCGRQFTRVDHLTLHMNRHAGCRPFCCGVCGTDFPKALDLKAHMKKHAAPKPFSCNQCTATFANAANLDRHQRGHSGEKPFKCPVCGATFPHRGALVGHQRIHIGHRPFVCELCEARFARADALKRHRRTHKELQQPPSQRVDVATETDEAEIRPEEHNYLSL